MVPTKPDQAAGKKDAERPPVDRGIGLCARCVWVRPQPTKRGRVFYRCARADEDDRFMQYPPVPVLRCTGFEEAPA